MAATEDVRGYATSSVSAENAVTGRPSAEELRSRLRQACAGSITGLASGLRRCVLARRCRCYAEAGASPSSEALPEEVPEVIGRGWLGIEDAARHSGCARESDSSEGARLRSRLQKLVRRIFLVGAACEATRGRQKTG